MLLVLVILVVTTVLLVTEWLPMEVTALLALGAVAVTGLVTPREVVAGFSNPAVVRQLAGNLHLSPRALMMGMAVAAASTFISPLAHPASRTRISSPPASSSTATPRS